MRWKGRRQSENIEDRRGRSAGSGVAVGGGIGTLVLVLLVALLGGDPSQLLSGQAPAGGGASSGQSRPMTQAEEESREFVSVVLADTEEIWSKLFAARGERYEAPRLVLFTGQVQSGCGFASAQVGPFYCGEDKTVYLDTSFFKEMRDRLGAGGDFAQAYVIAHEVGHHVQNLEGTLGQVAKARQRMSETQANALTVRLELQADFYAGVWAHHARDMASIDRQDIEEALEAAHAIGDDTLQKQAQGYVVPDAFTHGTSDQRMRWFVRGWETGDANQGDTFNQRSL